VEELKGRILYVHQREWATVRASSAEFLGSAAATTCLILILRSPISGKCSCAHFDSAGSVQLACLSSILASFSTEESQGGLAAHLAGAFALPPEDSPNHEPGIPLYDPLLAALHAADLRVDLQTLIVGEANTQKQSATNRSVPRVHSLFISPTSGRVVTQAVVNASDRGPALPGSARRSQHVWTGGIGVFCTTGTHTCNIIVGVY